MKRNIILRIIWTTLAINIINFSIDPPDIQKSHIAEDLSHNEIESMMEVVLEQVCHIENAVPESDEQGSEDGAMTVKKGIDFFVPQQISTVAFAALEARSSMLSDYKAQIPSQPYYLTFSPPPEA